MCIRDRRQLQHPFFFVRIFLTYQANLRGRRRMCKATTRSQPNLTKQTGLFFADRIAEVLQEVQDILLNGMLMQEKTLIGKLNYQKKERAHLLFGVIKFFLREPRKRCARFMVLIKKQGKYFGQDLPPT